MKRVSLLIVIAVLIMALASCSGTGKDTSSDVSAYNNDGNLEIKLYADKGIYSSDEQIVCHVTVEYIGEGDGITVYSEDPLVGFAIKGDCFTGKYNTINVLKETKFKKGTPVTFDFNKTYIPSPDVKSDFFDDFHKKKELYLPAGEYAISATLSYSLEKSDYKQSSHTISAETLVKVQKAGKLSSGSTIILVVIGLALVIIPSLLMMGKMRKQFHSWRHLNDYDPSHEDTFEEKLKKAKIQPQKFITFGQNRIAIDNIKKKLFIRSSKEPDGVLLNYKDIVSYEVIKDGNTIARNGSGFAGSATAGESGIICSDLRLVITTNKQTDPEVVLPFIAFSIDSEFAYNEALDSAKEAAQALERII